MSFETTSKPLSLLLLLLVIRGALCLAVLAYGDIGLAPDEAQYWTWSQALDWGYYSKPPGVAWQIWVGTQLFGNTEVGVRFLSVIMGSLISLAVYLLASACRLSPWASFWAGATMALTPLGVLASLLAITDVGQVLFWTLACIWIAQALAQGRSPNYFAVGLSLLAGALFKWNTYLLWLAIFLLIPLIPRLYNPRIWLGVAISCLGLLPSVVWNSQHHWVTFRHVFTSVAVGEEPSSAVIRGNFPEFVAAQVGLLSPIIFALLILALFTLRKREWREPILFCGGSSALLLGMMVGLSLFRKVQGNWVDFAYPTGIVFLTAYAFEKTKRGAAWLQAGCALAAALSVLLLTMPIPNRISPFKHYRGWNRLSDALRSAGYRPGEHFLVGDKYQMASLLSFYAPEQKRAYFFNLQGTRLNQFSFWPGLAEQQQGRSGFFVASENEPISDRDIKNYEDRLRPYFTHVEFKGVFPLLSEDGKRVKGALIFLCIGYNGKEPPQPERY